MFDLGLKMLGFFSLQSVYCQYCLYPQLTIDMDANHNVAMRQLIDFFRGGGNHENLDVALVRELWEELNLWSSVAYGNVEAKSIKENQDKILYIKDQNLQYVYGNDNFCNTLDIPRELLGKLTDQDLFGPGPGKEVESIDRELLANPRTISYETVRWIKDRLFNLETTKSVYQNEEGKPIGIIGVSRDVSREKAVEEKKRILDRKFELFFNQSMEAYCIFQVKDGKLGILLDFNDATCNLLGFSRSELKGLSGNEIIPFMNGFSFSDERGIDQNKWYPFRRTILSRKGGGKVSVDIGFHLTKLGQNQIMLAVMRDMTEYEQAYESVRRSESQLRALFQAIPDLVININRDGKLLDQKPGGGIDLLLSQELDPGVRTLEKMGHIWDFLPIENHSKARKIISRVLKDKRNETIEFKTNILEREEGVLDFEARLCPIDKEELVVFIREITDRKRRMAIIAKSEERLRLLYNSNPMMIINFDFDQRILSVNRSTLEALGYKAGELENLFREDLIHEEDRSLAVGEFENYLIADGENSSSEYRILCKNGDFFWVEEGAKVTVDLQGRRTVLVSCKDITRRRQAEQDIRESLKEKEILLREVHHRVKNNLQIINSVLSLQMGQYADPVLHDALRQSQNRILAMSLIHENLYRSEGISNINSWEYFRELCGHLFKTYNITSKQIRVEYHVENITLELVHAIPLGLITNELVTNVIKYAFDGMVGGGRVQISLRENEDNLCFTFSDNGIGLPEGLDPSMTKSMGFRLVQVLSRQLKGSFEFLGNEGLTFELIFPKEGLDQ